MHRTPRRLTCTPRLIQVCTARLINAANGRVQVVRFLQLLASIDQTTSDVSPFTTDPVKALRQSARMSEIENGGLDQYGAEHFEQQQFGTAGVEEVKITASRTQRG